MLLHKKLNGDTYLQERQHFSQTHRPEGELHSSNLSLPVHLLFALVMVYNVLGIALLLRPTAHQVSPLMEDALQPGLGQPLAGAIEEGTMLMLPLGSPLPALTRQARQHVMSCLSGLLGSLRVSVCRSNLKNRI